MDEPSSGLSRGQRWVLAVIAMPAVFAVSWILVSALAFVTPGLWTWMREPTFGEWVLRVVFLAAPFAITALVGWRLYRWIMRGEQGD